MLCLETGQINFKMFAVASFNSVGCTFLDWSLHYLSGQKNFYHTRSKTWIPLVSDPVSGSNAHAHLKNHPRGLERTKTCVELLNTISGVTSFYPTPLTLKESAASIGIDFNNTTSQQDFEKIFSKRKQDFVDTINYIADQKIDLVYVDVAPECVLYFIEPRTHENTVTKDPDGSTLYTKEQIKTDFQDLFFNDSVNAWANQKLTSKWDERERLALCSRPFDFYPADIVLQTPHLRLDARSLWINGEATMKKSLAHLKFDLDTSKLESWQQIYKKWQQPQLDSLEFMFNCQRIVNSIVNNHWLEIDLTFEQEVVIQHCLIYHHGLNLKTWMLEKFPNNTQELHKLLEPNIHVL